MRHRLSRAAALTALAGALLLVAGCGGSDETVEAVQAAGPQEHVLDWRERYPPTGPGLVFVVRSLSVTEDGWTAEIGVENRSGVHWELPEAEAAFRRTFGLMLFATGDLAELDASDALPPVRRGRSFRPAFPTFLAAGETWSGRMSAPGSLPAGRYARVVFGPFTSVAKPPEGMEKKVIWITDHAQRLRR